MTTERKAERCDMNRRSAVAGFEVSGLGEIGDMRLRSHQREEGQLVMEALLVMSPEER